MTITEEELDDFIENVKRTFVKYSYYEVEEHIGWCIERQDAFNIIDYHKRELIKKLNEVNDETNA